MIEEARGLPASMVTIGVVLVSLFVVLAIGTIAAVIADDTPAAPDLAEFPIVEGVQVVDSTSTCADLPCDGFGVLLMGKGLEEPVLSVRLVSFWRSDGWRSVVCVDDSRDCLANDDLRIYVRSWDQVDSLLAPTFVEIAENRGLEAAQLLYVHYYRCGAIYPCER